VESTLRNVVLNKQEVLGRTSSLLSFDMTRTSQKIKKLGGILRDTQRVSDLISLMSRKNYGDTQMDIQIDTDGCPYRKAILLVFFSQ
jgi:hypothetical protein